MWFSQYGRLWDGPWFLLGEVLPIMIYTAGIMRLADLPSAHLVMRDDL